MLVNGVFPCKGCPRQDSNLRSRLRRAVLYPLSYGGSATEKEYQGSLRWIAWAPGRCRIRGPSCGGSCLFSGCAGCQPPKSMCRPGKHTEAGGSCVGSPRSHSLLRRCLLPSWAGWGKPGLISGRAAVSRPRHIGRRRRAREPRKRGSRTGQPRRGSKPSRRPRPSDRRRSRHRSPPARPRHRRHPRGSRTCRRPCPQ